MAFNAFTLMDNFQQLEYEDLKKRILANPIADANRQQVLDKMKEILDKSGTDSALFLRGMKRMADYLDHGYSKQQETP